MNKVKEALKLEGYEVSNEVLGYRNNLDKWYFWWKGHIDSFHKYFVTDINKNLFKVDRKSLKMAKKVAEDWANLLLNDKTIIKVTDTGQKSEIGKSQIYLTGASVDQNSGVLGASNFWLQANKTIEKAYALGTGGFTIELVNPKVSNSKLVADDLVIKTIKDARYIIPLAYEDDDIISCAFAYEVRDNNKTYVKLRIMDRVEKGYTIKNRYYNVSDSSVHRVSNLNNEVEEYILPVKPFFIVKPNIENNIANVPYGVSCYANAIDQLESCDLAFDNFYNDFKLGRKKVFMNQDLIAMSKVNVKDAQGNDRVEKRPLIGDAIEQSLFVSLGTKDLSSATAYEEYNPTIRVNENVQGIQFFLNMLSSKVGFGQNKYRFDVISAATATEIKISNKDLTESVWKQRITIQAVLSEMVRSVLTLAKEVCSKEVDPNAVITIKFDDTMFSDEESERVRDLNEIRDGIMQKYEYRVKWYGEDVETAKKIIGDEGEE